MAISISRSSKITNYKDRVHGVMETEPAPGPWPNRPNTHRQQRELTRPLSGEKSPKEKIHTKDQVGMKEIDEILILFYFKNSVCKRNRIKITNLIVLSTSFNN